MKTKITEDENCYIKTLIVIIQRGLSPKYALCKQIWIIIRRTMLTNYTFVHILGNSLILWSAELWKQELGMKYLVYLTV